MMNNFWIIYTATVFSLFFNGVLAGFYGKDSSVLNLTPKSFHPEVYDTNYTTIVEYYAEWCTFVPFFFNIDCKEANENTGGHCKNLRPHYIKAAKSLSGLAKVAAVRCDDKSNQQLCAKANIKGYPTLKIYRPSKKVKSMPIVEDYQGARTAKAITSTVLDRLSNRVVRLNERDADAWLADV